MLVRHCVEASNVDAKSRVIDASKVCHVTVKAGRIEDMSGFIDPSTHLNLDFDMHKVSRCIVAEKLEKGAKVGYSTEGLKFAVVPQTAFIHLGSVDCTKRLSDMRESVKKIREPQNTGEEL